MFTETFQISIFWLSCDVTVFNPIIVSIEHYCAPLKCQMYATNRIFSFLFSVFLQDSNNYAINHTQQNYYYNTFFVYNRGVQTWYSSWQLLSRVVWSQWKSRSKWQPAHLCAKWCIIFLAPSIKTQLYHIDSCDLQYLQFSRLCD